MEHNTGRSATTMPFRRIALTSAAMLIGVLSLAGCDRDPPAVVSDPAPIASGTEVPGIPASGVDMSVPSASQALSGEAAPNAAATADGNAPNQKSAVSQSQEQQSMPLPGQANDHSNTVSEDKQAAPASAPTSGPAR